MSTFREMTVKGKCGHDVHISRKGLNMNIVKTLGKLPIKLSFSSSPFRAALGLPGTGPFGSDGPVFCKKIKDNE